MSERLHYLGSELTAAQHTALGALCLQYQVEYDENHYAPAIGLGEGWVCGFLGGPIQQEISPTPFIGCGPDGDVRFRNNRKEAL